jgi:type I restriction enzyme M protein
MLPEFKRRIDTLRDILVGAVPSPAGQIEQITYALIYKFMSDIDDRAASLPGGKRTYFTGEYEKYGWHELMAPTLGAHERLTLYREALSSLAKNPGLPELFQGIYQNAYLPFNDPRVLTLFLKEIDNFKHSTSDDIGDAYEYLLQITGAQGDVGQFRTPRHIIKFIVEAVNPTKTDSVLDPAVGTAGFLIAAYNHVKHHHDGVDDITGLPDKDEQRLTSDELDKLHHNYHGFDIDPTMVRTAKVNMYLHGFKTPDIKNHDSLSSEDHWNERYDVILANPPFMTPKGGIKPHDKFGITANRAEVLFVDYIASHLKPTGRAGIVVPEGIIFQSSKAYKELRKNLVDNYLYAVVSLPAGVFQPYSGVKTSILLLDKEIAKQRDEILFIKIENDGFSLGAQRREKAGSQFPEALQHIDTYKNGIMPHSDTSHTVKREEIANSSDCNLSGDRYKNGAIETHKEWPMVELGKILDYEQPQKYIVKSTDYSNTYATPVLTAGKSFILGYTNETSGIFDASRLPVIIFDDFTTATKLVDFTFKVKSSAMKILLAKDSVDVTYAYYAMQQLHFTPVEHKRFWISEYSKKKIPLPPIEIQREIVAELDGYRKIIEAAQIIVKTYKPTIKIDSEWVTYSLGDICEFTQGVQIPKEDLITEKKPGYDRYLYIQDFKGENKSLFARDQYPKKKLTVDDIVMANTGTPGRAFLAKPGILSNNLFKISFDTKKVSQKYLYIYLESEPFQTTLQLQMKGGIQKHLGHATIGTQKIPLPPIEIQREIVAELDGEQQLIDANKKLIEIYQQKIKNKIAEVWGE